MPVILIMFGFKPQIFPERSDPPLTGILFSLSLLTKQSIFGVDFSMHDRSSHLTLTWINTEFYISFFSLNFKNRMFIKKIVRILSFLIGVFLLITEIFDYFTFFYFNIDFFRWQEFWIWIFKSWQYLTFQKIWIRIQPKYSSSII